MSFESLGLAPELLEAVRACGYATPTPIQAKAIPHLLQGEDLMGCAQTGTGKTAAFALPILHQIRGTEPGHLRALVLVPTRELAMQVGRNIRMFAEPLGLRTASVYGGMPFGPQEMMLRHGIDVLVATPGRLKDFIWRGMIDFRETAFLVLDEADRMLDMGFIDDVREIVALIPAERQTMLFSATLDPQIVRLARDILRQPVRVEVAPSATVADGVTHAVISVRPGGKRAALEDLFREREVERTLVFMRTKRGAHQLSLHLRRAGHRVSSIHSDKSQSQRVAALEAFRDGKIDILVATDIAARGLDVQGISHVVNYDVPMHAEDYVHRIGRTARAGRTGVAVSIVAPEDRESVLAIERLIGRRLASGAAVVPTTVAPRSTSGRGPSRDRVAAHAGAERPARAQRADRSPSNRGSERTARPPRGLRDDRGGRLIHEERPVREGRRDREERPVRGARPARQDHSVRGGRPVREDRSARSIRVTREENTYRGGRTPDRPPVKETLVQRFLTRIGIQPAG